MTTVAPVPTNEAARLAALEELLILDTAEEPVFDAIAALAASICETPIALISLVDRERQWFKARVGLDVRETPREVAFCAHAIVDPDPTEIRDASVDPRFFDNPLVTGDPDIRFYAGRPLRDDQGNALGTLCVIDRVPRELTPGQRDAMEHLAVVVMRLFEARWENERAKSALRKSEARTRAITDNVPALIAYIDREQRYRFCNAEISRTFGTDAQQTIGRTMREVRGDAMYTELQPKIEAVLRGEPVSFEGQADVNGQSYWYRSDYLPDIDDHGNVAGFYAMTFNFTSQKQVELALAASELRLSMIANNVPAAISYIDTEHRYRFNNSVYSLWLDRPLEQITGRTLQEIHTEHSFEQIEQYLERALAGEATDFEITTELHGERRYLRGSYVPDRNSAGHVIGVYGLILDSTDLVIAQEKLRRLAQHDALTDLINRHRLSEIYIESNARSRRHGQAIALLFLDVDRFKSINDTYGHATGDDVLREFSLRLLSCTRDTDTVARLAGDEFVVLLENLHDPAEATLVAAKIQACIARPFVIADLQLNVGVSIGIAFAHHDQYDFSTLLKRADKALYAAKAAGRGTFHMALNEDVR